VGGTVGRVLVGRTHGELVAVRLSHQEGPRVVQTLPWRAAVRRDVGLEDLRTGGRADAPRAEDVFQSQRNAGHRGEFAAGVERPVDLLGPRAGQSLRDHEEGVQPLVHRVDAPKGRFHDRGSRGLTRPQEGSKLVSAEVAQLSHA
jgi:hypothetical protein